MTLREWYKAARELAESEKHLNRIAEIGNDFKKGEPLTDKAQAVMQQDIKAHFKKLAVVKQLSQLPQRDLVGLHQVVDKYLKTTPSPPADIERQAVQNGVQHLTQSINSLRKQQKATLAFVEAMQKSHFRSWNGKYDLAVAQVEQTANKLDNAIAYKQQKDHQLGQWHKLERAYSLWDKSPQTVEMRGLAKGLQSPQLQERLNSIPKVERQDFSRSQASSTRQAGLSL